MCSTELKLSSVLVIFILLPVSISHPPCGLYGAPPCQYLPAPAGQTPSCARPGTTYCEHVDNYPTYLIKHLVQKWGYEAKKLIVDETSDEFNALRHQQHEISNFYDPQHIFGPPSVVANHLNNFEGYKYNVPHDGGGVLRNNYHRPPEPIYIPKPADPTDYLIYSSLTPNYKQKITNGWIGPKVSQYNPSEWFKRYVRDLSQTKEQFDITPAAVVAVDGAVAERDSNSTRRFVRNVSEKQEFLDLLDESKDEAGKEEEEEGSKHRTKRQSPGRLTLCQTNSQFITPQAALNSRGNWMFVVNEMNTARQLVRTETCASTVCSNLCQLPTGYNSRCEQKYVQKRLVALNGNGQNLYTDTFWFPSCCVCTLSNS